MEILNISTPGDYRFPFINGYILRLRDLRICKLDHKGREIVDDLPLLIMFFKENNWTSLPLNVDIDDWQKCGLVTIEPCGCQVSYPVGDSHRKGPDRSFIINPVSYYERHPMLKLMKKYNVMPVPNGLVPWSKDIIQFRFNSTTTRWEYRYIQLKYGTSFKEYGMLPHLAALLAPIERVFHSKTVGLLTSTMLPILLPDLIDIIALYS